MREFLRLSLDAKLQAKFINKSVKDKQTGCIVWMGAKTNGYAVINFQGLNHRVHRLVAQAKFGELGKKVVCHKCDRPSCINPSHLFLGTQKENIQDCISKGRWADRSGEINHAKLQPSSVREIRLRYENGEKRTALAKEFAVGLSTVRDLINRKTWSNIL